MRILVVSNYYPPYHLGGYELCCQQVVNMLRARGHQVVVLTSTHGPAAPQTGHGVFRQLQLDVLWRKHPFYSLLFHTLNCERANQTAFDRLCTDFKPDLLYLWNLEHVSMSLAVRATVQRIPTAYFVSGLWLSAWEKTDAWYSVWRREPKRLVSKIGKRILAWLCNRWNIQVIHPLELNFAQFMSQFLCKRTLGAGKEIKHISIIPWGVELESYPYKASSGKTTRLLCVGQLIPGKATHVAIQALDCLVRDFGYDQLTLTIVGKGQELEYPEYLQSLTLERGLSNRVHFAGAVPYEAMPAIYQAHDIIIAPSEFEEGFGLILVEAMASGLGVVGTALGGSAEVLVHENNGLVFPAGDERACANQIHRFIQDPSFYDCIRHRARKIVEESFRLELTFDAIENDLQQLVTI